MAADRNIPFLDLITPHLQLEEELVTVFRTALRNAAFIGGPGVENFERAFAAERRLIGAVPLPPGLSLFAVASAT